MNIKTKALKLKVKSEGKPFQFIGRKRENAHHKMSNDLKRLINRKEL